MNAKLQVLELQTENFGTFTFTKHFNAPNTSPYDAMICFESNNWEKLGSCTYVAILRFEDDTNTTTSFEGINASANLAEFISGLNEI